MKASQCSTCGLPRGIGKGNIWHYNGVLTSAYPPFIRGTLYDLRELDNLFSEFSRRVGFDISRLVVEGKRKDGKRYADSLMNNLKTMKGETPPPMEVYSMIARFSNIWGLGRVKVKEYRPGETLTLSIENVYSVPMYRGDVAGIFEAVEGKRGDPSWAGDYERGEVRVVAIPGEPELEQRIESEIELGIPSVGGEEVEYERCAECGAPLEVSRQMDWDAERGTIIERISGCRYVLHNTNGIVAVVRVLIDELGEEVEQMLVDISRQYARGYYGKLVDKSTILEELAKFSLRSWGCPTVGDKDRSIMRIRVINPYSPQMVAGRVWGLFEALEKREMKLTEFSEGHGFVEFILQS